MTKAKKVLRKQRVFLSDKGPKGPFAMVDVSPAKSAVKMLGSAMHALKGLRGVTIGCGLSNCAKASEDSFPHRVILASFTKSRALIVDRVDRCGLPCHAVLYRHYYHNIVKYNDNGSLAKLLNLHPDFMDREFILYPPQINERGSTTGLRRDAGKPKAARNGPIIHRGALQRAIDAGLIMPVVVEQMARR